MLGLKSQQGILEGNEKSIQKVNLDKTQDIKLLSSCFSQGSSNPCPKNIDEYLNQLKNHLKQLLKTRDSTLKAYFASVGQKLQASDKKYDKEFLLDYLKMLQQKKIETYIPTKAYQSALNELIQLTVQQIITIQRRLSAEQIQKYQRISKFNECMMEKFQTKIKYPKSYYTVRWTLQLDIMALFFWRNSKYRQTYGIQALISGRTITKIFVIAQIEYKRFYQRFQSMIQLCELKFIGDIQAICILFCLIQLQRKISYLHRDRLKYKSSPKFPALDQRNGKSSLENLSFKFQFCQIVLFPLYSMNIFTKKGEKAKEAIVKQLKFLIGQKDLLNVKTQLLRIKNEYLLCLNSTVELYHELCKNPERKITLSEQQKAQLYKQLQYVKWLYFTRNITLDVRYKTSYIYYEKHRFFNQQNPSAIVLFKITMQRFKLMKKVNDLLLNFIKGKKLPIMFIHRFDFSLRKIKENGGEVITKENDLLYTHVLGVQEGKLKFSALIKQALPDREYGDFLFNFCESKLNLKDKKIVLYQFEHNREVYWDALISMFKSFKLKLQSDIIVANDPNKFLLHFFINFSIQWILAQNASNIRRENFYQMIQITRHSVINEVLKARREIKSILIQDRKNESGNESAEWYTNKAEQLTSKMSLNAHVKQKIIQEKQNKQQQRDVPFEYSLYSQSFHQLHEQETKINSLLSINNASKAIFLQYFLKQLKKKYVYIEQCDKEEVSTNFSLLLEKYSMTTADVKNILTRTSRYILIAEAIFNEIHLKKDALISAQESCGKSNIDVSQLSMIFKEEKSRLESICPGQRQVFYKRNLSISKYPVTRQTFSQ